MREKITFNRRQFIKCTALAGAALTLPFKGRAVGYTVNCSPNLGKWKTDLRGLGPSGIPVLSGVPDPVLPNTTLYRITAGEFTDQLHPDLGPTRLWGYWDSTNPVQRHLGGFFIGSRGKAARFRMTNTLPEDPIIPADAGAFFFDGAKRKNAIATHLHGGFVPWLSDGGPFEWFCPNGSQFPSGPAFSNGPGGVFDNISAMPMQPGQADYFYPNDQSFRLMWYHDHAHDITRVNAYAGLATGYLLFDSINDAYVKAGKIPGLPSTIPLIFQDKKFVWEQTPALDPTWATIMKASVQSRGSLWYRHLYDPGDVVAGGTLPLYDPSCVPEYFGDTMLANGTVFPTVTVEAKRYRFLALNACNARVLNLNLYVADPSNPDGIGYANPALGIPSNQSGPPIIQLGSEGGFLPKEVVFIGAKPFGFDAATGAPIGNLFLAPAERADLIIDFTGFAGTDIILYNDSPAPFPGGDPGNDYYLGNPANPVQPNAGTGPDTRQILRIHVVAATAADSQPKDSSGNYMPILDSKLLDPAPIVDLSGVAISSDPTVAVPPLSLPIGIPVRDLTLNEGFDDCGRLTQTLGTLAPTTSTMGAGFGRKLVDPPTEVLKSGATEVWRLWNFTGDTHPIHFHLVNLQILFRQQYLQDGNGLPVITGGFPVPTGVARGPDRNELGWKEVVRMHPGEVITFIAKFDLPAVPFKVPSSPRLAEIAKSADPGDLAGWDGKSALNEYVYHCHILEHEEHDMMRPLVTVGTPLAVTLVQEVTIPEKGTTTATFYVSGGTGEKFTVTPDPVPSGGSSGGSGKSPSLSTPLVTAKGFLVKVSSAAKPGNYSYTVKDDSGASVIGVLRVLAAQKS